MASWDFIVPLDEALPDAPPLALGGRFLTPELTLHLATQRAGLMQFFADGLEVPDSSSKSFFEAVFFLLLRSLLWLGWFGLTPVKST